MAFQPPRLLSSKELNILRGKVLTNNAYTVDILQVFGHIDCLESELDQLDYDLVIGAGGWRKEFGVPE